MLNPTVRGHGDVEANTQLPAKAEQDSLRADLPYQAEASDPIQHDVDFVVTVTPPAGCKLLKVWLPLPPSDGGQEISNRQITTFPMEVEPRVETEILFGNTFAYFEFENPQGAQIIRHSFKAKVWNQHWKLDPSKVQDVESWPRGFAQYLEPETVNAADDFQTVTAMLSARFSQPLTQMDLLLRAMDWVDENMTYDHVNASLAADVNHAFELRRGHCSDYHGLCATMGRTLGTPTRVIYGLALYPKSSPSHCKMEAFLPPYGWVSFDLSETQKLVAAIEQNAELPAEEKATLSQAARDRLKSGFRENSYLVVTKGTDYELAPKASRRVRVVRTIYAEADGVPLPEPDPSNPEQTTFAWMTAHKYSSDKPFKLPFKDWSTLDDAASNGNQ